MDIRKDLLGREEIAESSDLRPLPLSSRVSDCLATPLALASPWKSKGAALGALLKIRAPDLSNPSKPTEKELTSAKNWKILMRERMFVEEIDAASAAFEVGYESASQFNREYKRFFGQPPMRDIKVASARRLRNRQRLTTVQMMLSKLTDSRHLNEIFFDTLQVCRFCVHDSLKPYAICRKSYDTKLDSRIGCRMSL
jgi:AraC-like DNA-binding protein